MDIQAHHEGQAVRIEVQLALPTIPQPSPEIDCPDCPDARKKAMLYEYSDSPVEPTGRQNIYVLPPHRDSARPSARRRALCAVQWRGGAQVITKWRPDLSANNRPYYRRGFVPSVLSRLGYQHPNAIAGWRGFGIRKNERYFIYSISLQHPLIQPKYASAPKRIGVACE